MNESSKETLNRIANHLTVYIPLIIGFVGLLILNFSTIEIPVSILNILNSIVLAILVSGFFSATIHVFQFRGIFKKELTKSLIDPDFLCLRKDLNKIWADVSRLLYQRRFPEIGDEIDKVITQKYFPIKHSHYYTDYKSECYYTKLDNDFVKLIEKNSFKIVAQNSDEVIPYNFSNVLPLLDSSDTRTSIIVNEFKIDENKAVDNKKINKSLLNIEKNTNDVDLIFKAFTVNLTGKKEYHISYEFEKIYALKTNPTKSFSALFICKDFELYVEYPSSMRIYFNKGGTINEYKNILVGNNSTRIQLKYEGIIFPQQGYVLGLAFK